MQDYKKLTEEIRKNSFPEIKRKVFVRRMNLIMGLAGALSLPFRLNFIFMTPKLDNKSKKYIRGVLAHELSHISKNQELTFLKTLVGGFKYYIFDFEKKFRKNQEVETDKLAIRKGFFKEIYEISKDRKTKRQKKYYLDSKQVLNYYNKIRKNS